MTTHTFSKDERYGAAAPINIAGAVLYWAETAVRREDYDSITHEGDRSSITAEGLRLTFRAEGTTMHAEVTKEATGELVSQESRTVEAGYEAFNLIADIGMDIDKLAAEA